jgi:hypothetical protein
MSALGEDANLWIASDRRKEQFFVKEQSEHVMASNGQNLGCLYQ